jgi:hypothetical protein
MIARAGIGQVQRQRIMPLLATQIVVVVAMFHGIRRIKRRAAIRKVCAAWVEQGVCIALPRIDLQF